ncbi:MAG: hypothetical protein M1816_005335, partial [Peltula sp. TS41687]
MTFLKWILDHHRVQKKSSLHEYWRVWRMLYRKCVGRSLHAKVMEEVNDTLPLSLTGDKRLQIALLILISAYTATRPGALVYVARNNKEQRRYRISEDSADDDENESVNDDNDNMMDGEEVKTLCYEDVALITLPNPTGIRDILAMEINIQYTKGHQKNPRRKLYILSEVDTLIFDAIVLMVTIAIIDDAFESKIKSKTPIFRQAVSSTNGVQTSDRKALRYHTYLYYIQRLGFAAGFPQILEPYQIRRGSGEAVDAVGTQALLQQVKDAGIFQAYINERVQCDVQAAFLGRPSADALIKAVSHMSRYVDPRAPTELTESGLNTLKSHPEIVRLRQLRDNLTQEARRQYGTVKNAEAAGSKISEMRQKAEAALRCSKVKLRNTAVKESREEFFNTVDTREVNKQLDSTLLGLDQEGWKPTKVEHAIEERRLVAKLLCEQPSDLTHQTNLEYRIQTINTLIALCR